MLLSCRKRAAIVRGALFVFEESGYIGNRVLDYGSCLIYLYFLELTFYIAQFVTKCASSR